MNSPSSPTLSRRVTGFFSSYKKRNKDKVKTSAVQENVVDPTNTETPMNAEVEGQTNYETEAIAANTVKGTVSETTNIAAGVV